MTLFTLERHSSTLKHVCGVMNILSSVCWVNSYVGSLRAVARVGEGVVTDHAT